MAQTGSTGCNMKTSQKVLRSMAYDLLPLLPSKWVQWFRDRTVLKDVLDRLSINCVIDVGANHGQFGMWLRRSGYKGWIISFEPVASNFEILQAVAKKNGPWRTFSYALGAEEGQREINVTAGSDYSSFLRPREESQAVFYGNRVERTERVLVRRLDHVLKSCIEGIPAPRMYLKLDTQGFDLEVLDGARSILPNILALQTEVSLRHIYQGMHSFAESVSCFQASGFEVIDFLTVSRDRDQLCAVEMDCLMARSGWKEAANGDGPSVNGSSG
jgi:FkbM family methyltransferase